MTHEELREKVARALYYTPIAGTSGVIPTWETVSVEVQHLCLAEADAAINIVLEEAARVADKQAWAHGGRHFNGPELNSAAIAAAIRAMKKD